MSRIRNTAFGYRTLNSLLLYYRADLHITIGSGGYGLFHSAHLKGIIKNIQNIINAPRFLRKILLPGQLIRKEAKFLVPDGVI
jgi:hypothetical protein